jgi:hypothetical protein
MLQTMPQILLIVRAGRKSIHRSWLWTTNGLADVALSIYDDSDVSEDDVKFIHHARGGKFPGLMAFFDAFPQVIESYDYFWLFEDDLVLPFESLQQTVNILSRFPFDLSAPSLTYYSFFTWPIAVRNSQFLFRCTNFVEVMAPIMSRTFLRRAMVAFNDNFSGWGHEWLWSRLLAETQSFAAILDSAPITHTRPFGGGPLYKNRPPEGWTPKEDMERMLAKYGLDKNVQFRNFFAVSSNEPHRILVQNELLQHALTGYADMQVLRNDNFARCLEALIKGARPVTPLADLQKTAGFRMVQTVVNA